MQVQDRASGHNLGVPLIVGISRGLQIEELRCPILLSASMLDIQLAAEQPRTKKLG